MTTPTGILFSFPVAQPLNSGAVVGASSLQFYLTGTTTLATIYTDGALSTPASNPLNADSTGTFAAIYLDPTVTYRVQWYAGSNATGTKLKDIDPYLPQTGRSSSGLLYAASVSAGAFGETIQNTSNNATSMTRTAWTNDASSSLIAAMASSTRVAAPITNAPTSTQGLLYTTGAYPLVLGANGAAGLQITSTQAIQGWGASSSGWEDMTPDHGTFTVTGTGFSGSVTGTATWARIGKLVIVSLPGLSGTSNATSFTLTGIPAAIQPPTLNQNFCISNGQDNTVQSYLIIGVAAASGTWTLNKMTNGGAGFGFSSTGFTASGTKGMSVTAIAYMLL